MAAEVEAEAEAAEVEAVGNAGKQMVTAVIHWNGWRVRKCVLGL
jgi:hypothetical protein